MLFVFLFVQAQSIRKKQIRRIVSESLIMMAIPYIFVEFYTIMLPEEGSSDQFIFSKFKDNC